MLNWFVGKELRHKVELTIGEAQPIQNHRHHGCSYAHTSATSTCEIALKKDLDPP
jgi:hypothetical protein